MEDSEYISVYAPAPLAEQVGEQVHAVCSTKSLIMNMERENGDHCFVILAPKSEIDALEAAIKRVEGAALARAVPRDIQQFERWREGTAPAELDL